MRLFLLDSSDLFPSNPLFADALSSVGLEYGFQHRWFDESEFSVPPWAIYLDKLFRRVSGRRPLVYWKLNRAFVETASVYGPEIVLITSGKFLNPASIRAVKKKTGALLINYATDDPFNDAVNTSMFKKAIPYYDVYVCTKRAILEDVRKAGCDNVIYLPFAYKPEVHFPEGARNSEEQLRYSSDVVFIGGCDNDRLPYIVEMLRAVPNMRLHLYGNFWNRHPGLRRYYRGFALGREFRLAVGGAKIAFNLIRRANRDDHVMRTFEIPACGGFMLTDRTDEQCSLLAEDREASYFSSSKEMVDKIRYYLAHDSERRQIAEAGYRRITAGGNTYGDRLKSILDTVRARGM